MAAQNWREYFDDKLADERSLRLQHSDNSTLISSEATDIDTVIEILYGDGDGDLHDILFWNPESPGWTKDVKRERRLGEGFYFSERAFTPENIPGMEDWLAIPLYRGWSEEVAYLKGKHVKSRVRWQQDGKTVEFPVTMEDVGCAMSIFQALRHSDRLNRGQMQKRSITIKPMVEAV